MADQQVEEGWNWVANSRRCHYFRKNGRSLCSRYLSLAPVHWNNPVLHEACPACERKLEQRKVKAA